MFSTLHETNNSQDHSIPLFVKAFGLLFSIIYVMDTEQKADSIFRVARKVILVCVIYIVTGVACVILWEFAVMMYYTIKLIYMIYTWPQK
jgi:cytochrome c oxidase subunit IV